MAAPAEAEPPPLGDVIESSFDGANYLSLSLSPPFFLSFFSNELNDCHGFLR